MMRRRSASGAPIGATPTTGDAGGGTDVSDDTMVSQISGGDNDAGNVGVGCAAETGGGTGGPADSATDSSST